MSSQKQATGYHLNYPREAALPAATCRRLVESIAAAPTFPLPTPISGGSASLLPVDFHRKSTVAFVTRAQHLLDHALYFYACSLYYLTLSICIEYDGKLTFSLKRRGGIKTCDSNDIVTVQKSTEGTNLSFIEAG